MTTWASRLISGGNRGLARQPLGKNRGIADLDREHLVDVAFQLRVWEIAQAHRQAMEEQARLYNEAIYNQQMAMYEQQLRAAQIARGNWVDASDPLGQVREKPANARVVEPLQLTEK